MRNVYVTGIGMTKFGILPDMNLREIGETAVWAALKDAGLKPSDIGVAYCGYAVSGHIYDQELVMGHTCLRELGIKEIPILRVEQACNSGGFAVREAFLAIQSGFYDVALAFGLEKMFGRGTQKAVDALSKGLDTELYAEYGLTPGATFGLISKRHMYDYGTTVEQMAMVSVKNRRHAALNPRAQFQKELTIEGVLTAPMIAEPVTLPMCCPITDGGAAAILVSEDFLRKRNCRKPVKILASVGASGSPSWTYKLSSHENYAISSKLGYEMAGLGPNDIDVAAVHEPCAIMEIMTYEGLGFCPMGEGGRFVESGASSLGGRLPVNTDGGTLSRGHAIAATGVAQIGEIVTQMRGEAGPRQVEGAKIGLQHCVGGYQMGDACGSTLHILERSSEI